jgi:flagellar motility protein MotE (MotC chaperone)
MVTMIGILVTFAVGWQIINALEIKSKLAEIEKIKADVNTQQSNINKIAARIAYDAAVNRGYTLKNKANTIEHLQLYKRLLKTVCLLMNTRIWICY